MDMFSALLGKSLSGGGGSEPVLVSKSITSNGIYDPADDNADGFSSVTVTVPNSYTVADEGKVVSNGELVSQTSSTVTQNGTVDTTLINSLVVNVSGGVGSAIKLSTDNTYIYDDDMYIIETTNSIYFFGSGSNSGTSSKDATFTIPESFDLSKIGTFSDGAKRGSSQSAASKITSNDLSLNKTNRTVVFFFYPSTTTVSIARFNKST